MTTPTALEIGVLLLVGAVGTAVALERNPLRQSMVSGAFGLVLAVLFLVFQAPDVALSEIVVGSVVIPLVVLVALTRTGGKER